MLLGIIRLFKDDSKVTPKTLAYMSFKPIKYS